MAKKNISYLDGIDLEKREKMVNLDIVPKLSTLIPKDDHKTSLLVVIDALPYPKTVPSQKGSTTMVERLFIDVIYQGLKYQQSAESITCRNSLVECAMKIYNLKASDITESSMEMLKGTSLIARRNPFISKEGYSQEPICFYVPLDLKNKQKD